MVLIYRLTMTHVQQNIKISTSVDETESPVPATVLVYEQHSLTEKEANGKRLEATEGLRFQTLTASLLIKLTF
jgi:hypothetical protein